MRSDSEIPVSESDYLFLPFKRSSMDLFFIKKFVSVFLHPMPILIGAQVIGLGFYLFGKVVPKGASGSEAGWTRDSMDSREKIRRRRVRRGRFGLTVALLSLAALYLLGLGPISKMIADPLVEAYPVFDPATADFADGEQVYIVVLGAGYARAPGYPISSRLATDSAQRFLEGVRIYREMPGSKLVVTGGDHVEGEDKRLTAADGMVEMSRLMGIAEEDILSERDSRDTKDHPLKIMPLIGDQRKVIVVTSAMHMRRSMALFKKQGYQPLPAPVGLLPSNSRWFTLSNLMPSAGNYRRIDAAVHEYLGLLWASMRGQID